MGWSDRMRNVLHSQGEKKCLKYAKGNWIGYILRRAQKDISLLFYIKSPRLVYIESNKPITLL